MIYALDDSELLGLWTVIRYLGELREVADPMDRSEILTQAQIHLTAFIIGLQPLSEDQGNPFTGGIRLRAGPGFDA